MGCCGCGHKSWTKTFISFTIIFCLSQFGAQIFALINYYGKYNLALQKYFSSKSFTVGLTITSIVLNILWFFTCIDVLVRLRRRELKQSLVTSYILWDIAAIASFIMDIVATILYAIDFSKNYENLNKESFKALLILIIISARFVIGFIFNIFAIIGMIIITNLSRKKIAKQPKKRFVPLKPPKPVLKKPTREAYLEENNIDRVRDWHNHYENTNDYQRNPMNAPNYIPRISEIPSSNESELNTISQNNDAAHNHALPGSNTNIFVNGVPSGTLRRQLPWTYMPNPNELPHMQPRKVPVPVSTPYVPAPDYYQKNPKPISRRDFTEPGWSQHL